ncbi:unnamed protein product [Soboliphyme baturini]|uniref:Globin family profile domain-containing protein n=1 Tax=Soboliphyme baturini TaxID=241478 RepID=A0A3P8CG30_9BILA|nr:unnamed protein product [Soboliphyme baturini]
MSFQGLFPFRKVPDNKLKENKQFVKQASIFADFINSVVQAVRIDNVVVLNNLCQNVGASHYYLIGGDFKYEWWLLFSSSVLDCLREYCELRGLLRCFNACVSTKILNAWKVLLRYVVNAMIASFCNARSTSSGNSKTKQHSSLRQEHTVGKETFNQNFSEVGKSFHSKKIGITAD